MPTPLWDYLTDGEGVFLWVALGAAVIVILVFVFCTFSYFSKRQPLRKNKNLAIQKIEREKEKQALELKLGTIAEENKQDPDQS